MPQYDPITQALIDTSGDIAKLVYRESQRRVPVRSRHLKRSGKIVTLPDGAEVVYTEPYAGIVENGAPAHSERVRSHDRGPFQRQLPHYQARFARYRAGRARRPARRYTQVRRHTVHAYTRQVKERTGTHFLAQSIAAVEPQVPRLLERAIRRATGQRVNISITESKR